MSAESSVLRAPLDNDTKAEEPAALEVMGLLFYAINADQVFQLELKVPNCTTRTALAEADALLKDGALRFDHADDRLAGLDDAAT